jgi:hypothetical protein
MITSTSKVTDVLVLIFVIFSFLLFLDNTLLIDHLQNSELILKLYA